MTQPLPARQPRAPALRNDSRQGTALVIRTTDARGEREVSCASVRSGDRSLPGVADPAPQMRFSIIVTSHNQREFIRDAVDSALSVRNAETEVIVIDDASSDGSQEILWGYGDAIRFASLEANRGASAARNHGASMASGDYLVFLDGDDALQPWALEIYERMIQTRKPKLILASIHWLRGEVPSPQLCGRPSEIQFVDYEDYLRRDRAFACSASAIVVDRHSFLSAGGWSPEFHLMTDQDLLMKLSESGRTVQILWPHTCHYRIHAANSANRVPRYVQQVHKLIDKEHSEAYPGGRRRRFDRHVVLGREVFHWVRGAIRARLYRDAFELAKVGWPMCLAALLRRLDVMLTGRVRLETIAI